ncbi:MAG: hypothetical protein EOP37_21070 [Rubrivivax sp.]|nr:MAG: hypothetical protein EOP37_21070 [Rubrivivax sp.]
MKDQEKTPHRDDGQVASLDHLPETLSLEGIREQRSRTLYLWPLDAILLAIGFLFFWEFSHAISEAMATGEIKVAPRLRHSVAESVPWPQGWAVSSFKCNTSDEVQSQH